MSTLYIDEQGAHLHRTGNRLLVSKDEKTLAEVELIHVERVVISGNVSITSAALGTFLKDGIDCVFLDYHGRFLGRLEGVGSRNVLLREAQYRLAADEARSLAIARRIVQGKLANCRASLMRNCPPDDAQAQAAIAQLAAAETEAGTAADASSLLGVEGAGTRAYFGAFPIADRIAWGFGGRRRRPPTDPVNSALSLAYTVLLGEAVTAAAVAGFDPYCGFFHRETYGRPSLALDLMEEFRPVVADSVVLTLFGKRMAKPDEFESTDEGIRMNEQLRERFYRLFESRLLTEVQYGDGAARLTYRGVIRSQALALARVVTGDQDTYTPFTWR